nr:response regulator [Acuticoccus sediminis]
MTNDENRKRTAVSVPPIVAVVDDDESMRDALEALIDSLGYRARTFASADDYLRSKGEVDVGCMILDVQMPGTNGLDLQTQLVEANAAPPIIFVTSYGDDNVRRRAMRGGALYVLEKPVQDRVIIRCLEEALASHQGDA